LEQQIAAAEVRKAEAEAELAAHGSDHVVVARLYHELQALEETLERNLERWAELADLAG
jgi:ATP-binding cassette subfamily F protein uup